MIKTAEEFIKLRQSELKEDQEQATHQPADLNVWIDVINKYPEFKTWVIHNKTIQIEILETLAMDKDPKVRCDVARKRKINESIFNVLSVDSDENVRHALISNTALTLEQLKKIKVDNSAWLTNALNEKIKNASR
jgi:hypothetical protein